MRWLSLILLVACTSTVSGSDGRVSIDDVRVEAGIVRMQVALHLIEEQSVYEWRGHIYPLLGYGLHVEAVLPSGENLQVENALKVVPKMPRNRDVVRARDYSYPEPLQLVISRSKGTTLEGCAQVTVRYDTTTMRVLGPLDSVRLDPATVQVCFPG